MSRITELQRLLPEDVDGALITSDINRRYFTGMKSSAGVVLVTRSEVFLLIDFRYYEKACSVVTDCSVVLMKDLRAQLTELCERYQITVLAVESSAMTLRELDSYKDKLPDVTFVVDGRLSASICELRVVKSEEELASIRSAQAIAEQALEGMLDLIHPGAAERDIALELDYRMLRAGAEAISFDTIAVAGANSSLPHGVPGDRKLCKGDFLVMDFGAVVHGYHSDMTRTFAIGEPDDEMRKIYDCVLRAQQAAIAIAHAGITAEAYDEAGRAVIREAGYGEYFGHSLGHGVGLEIHEAPAAAPRQATLLRDGMVVTAEPGIYLPGRFGVRIEDMLVMRQEGCENLTRFPKTLTVL